MPDRGAQPQKVATHKVLKVRCEEGVSDFYLGDPDQIQADDRSFLVSVKQFLPIAINLLQDSEYLALYDSIVNSFIPKPSKPVCVETGIGASTIVLAFCGAKCNGQIFSWGTNHLKGGFIKLCLADHVARHCCGLLAWRLCGL